MFHKGSVYPKMSSKFMENQSVNQSFNQSANQKLII